ncbi:MAG: tRNA uridine-5-carboxymethylaminomethyl(34) synthesis GTPase MnmE [Desulfatiglans sp.]|nr:tRNA uridine-5-carboxymethylaminomethyl(34) synthesis GTPase MnmE [Thermodesulfobacteriota bacterium]MEE4352903.1 tRNA uridine-5-carboxymethylaminomethyl(34) synthesis GTPase MnmE [Desulfatiglans sp.]
MYSLEDTISAIATPIGQAGIGIIRISGPLSFEIARKIFNPQGSKVPLQSHRLYLGHLHNPATGVMIDEVLLSFMKAPHSYTREDVIEINSHSGYLLLSSILQVILDQGARLARPGEFTLRAFLNGRIDLTQAEGVIDLINSKSTRGLQLASEQIRGSLREDIESLRQKVIDILSIIEVAIDYPDEVVDIVDIEETVNLVEETVIKSIEALIKAHEDKRIWVDGVKIVIAGRVNAGKSSLLNFLLKDNRAIVTPVPGTTRDAIESTTTIDGLPICLVDTAGFRDPDSEVEKIGIRLSQEKLAEADFIIIVVDQNRPLNRDDYHIMNLARGRKALLAINKIDLLSRLRQDDKKALSDFPCVRISALNGEGIDSLKRALVTCLIQNGNDMTTSHAVPNVRHQKALQDALRFIQSALDSMRNDEPLEIIAFNLQAGLDALGEIIGKTSEEEILNNIFGTFCLGK